MLGAAATSGVIVAVLGFSLRGVMADIFAGIALGLERAYRIGDWITIEGGRAGLTPREAACRLASEVAQRKGADGRSPKRGKVLLP